MLNERELDGVFYRLASYPNGLQVASVEMLARIGDQFPVATEVLEQHDVEVGNELEEFEYGCLNIELREPFQFCRSSGNILPETCIQAVQVLYVRVVSGLSSFHVTKLFLVPKDDDLFSPQQRWKGLSNAYL